MKSAEEWQVNIEKRNLNSGSFLKEQIEQIQLDALKEGMRRAADLKPNMMQTEVYGETEQCWQTGYNAGTAEHCSRILSAAEQLTENHLL